MTAVKAFAPYEPFSAPYNANEVAMKPQASVTLISLGPRRRLTAVKHTLYNPALPSLRRMSMDEVLGKLPEEHSRFTTPCSKGKVVF